MSIQACCSCGTLEHNARDHSFGGECQCGSCSNDLLSEQDLRSVPCEKNQGHAQFIPIENLNMDSSPEGFKNCEFLKFIRILANITVKIKVSFVSQRPEVRLRTATKYPHSDEKGRKNTTRVGTGFVGKVTCKNEDSRSAEGQGRCSRSYGLKIITSRHHVWNQAELESVQLEICFHDADGHEVLLKTLKADSRSEYSVINMDVCALLFTTCDVELGEPLAGFCDEFWKMTNGLKEFCSASDGREILALVSYPHGCQKCVTFGEVANSLLYLTENTTSAIYLLAVYLSHSLTLRSDKDMCAAYTTPTCEGCSGALVIFYCKSDDCLKICIHEGYQTDALNHSGNPEFIREECHGVSDDGSSALQKRRKYSLRIDDDETNRFNDAQELSVADKYDYALLRLDEKALTDLSHLLYGPEIEDKVLELICQANHKFGAEMEAESPSHSTKQRVTRKWQFLCEELESLLKQYDRSRDEPRPSR